MAFKNEPFKGTMSQHEGNVVHKFPNRQRRRWEARIKATSHNNRKATDARKTERVELQRVVMKPNPEKKGKFIRALEKTGIIRSIRKLNNWRFGGFRTQSK